MLDRLNQPKGSTIGVLRDGRTTQEAIEELTNDVTGSITTTRYASSASQALFPKLIDKMTAYRHGVPGFQDKFRIYGYGSSVGNGATIGGNSSPNTPVAKFFEHFQRTVNKAGIYPFEYSNKSVDGSNINDFLNREWPSTVATGVFPDLAVFAYGMNDFPSAQYNAGMTFGANGFKQRLRNAIQKVRDAGGDVVLLTTPHPNIEEYSWELPSSIDMVWPQFAAKPVAGDVLIPPVSQSNVSFDFMGKRITQGVRFLRGNDAMREVAVEMGCVLIDVEKYWFEAVGKYGNVLLFDRVPAMQTVHPNLLGHQQSYWRAIEEFFNNVDSSGWIAPDARLNQTLDVGGNALNPAKMEADVDLQANGIRQRAFVRRDKSGRIMEELMQDSKVQRTAYTVAEPTVSAPGYSLTWNEWFSRTKGLFSNGETLTIPITNRTEGRLLVNLWTSAQQTWTQLEDYLVSNREGVVQLVKVGGIDTTSTPGQRMFTVSTTTNGVVITVLQDNASLKFKLDTFGV